MVIAMVEDMAIIKYLDVLEYVKGSRKAKNHDDLAEYQGRKIESAIETAVQYVKNDHKELVTKGDLSREVNLLRGEIQLVRTELKEDIKDLRTEVKIEIKDLRYDTFKFIVWTGAAVVMTILSPLVGIFGRVFHWF